MSGRMNNLTSFLAYRPTFSPASDPDALSRAHGLPISRRTIGAVGLTAAFLLGAPAGALAGGTPPTVTVPFSSTGSEQSFTVPVGVSSVRVTAIGEAGEAATSTQLDERSNDQGGAGADVVGQLPVTVGEVLYAEVADNGFNGAGPGQGNGGTGGDASDVRTVSRESPETIESRLLVAAGGGGGGGTWNEFGGGRGGDAGSHGDSSSGGDFGEGTNSLGGGAGTLTGGGAGGAGCFQAPSEPWFGANGALGLGGSGGQSHGLPETGGGGGGGGYWGGGGGEGSCEFGGASGGAGGGGGSSFVTEAATFASFGLASSSTAPSISITYATPATATPDRDAITFTATQPLETVSPPQTLTITNEGGNPLVINSETFTDSDPGVPTDKPEDFLISSSSCLGPLAYEESCTLTVRFTPEAEGPQTATLKISSNTGAEPTSVTLTGTGGTLPQGPTGATGAEGKEGKEGPTGANGSQGATGATGPQGTTGATGPQGSTGEAGPKGETGAAGPQGTAGEAGKLGIAGAIGPKGPKGDKGAKGDRGAQGPQGLTALYVCHKRELHGKYKKACFVQVLSASSSAVKATLSRNGVIYARGKGGGTSSKTLELGASKPVPNGHYELTLISKSLASTTRTITVG